MPITGHRGAMFHQLNDNKMKQTVTDHLAGELLAIEATCTAHNIALFYGQVEEGKSPQAVWRDPEAEHVDGFTNVLLRAAPALLIVDVERYFERDDNTEGELVQQHKARLNGEKLQVYETAQEHLKMRKGHVITYTLTFFHQGIPFRFERDADWLEHFNTYTDAYDLDESDADDDEDDYDDELSEEETAVIDTVIVNPDFQKAKSSSERMHLVREALKGAGILKETRLCQITTEAQERFTREVLPLREAEDRRQVQELKREGKTKTEVKSRLKLSTAQLNRHWY